MTGPADEFALIARYFAPLAADAPGAFGLADDAAELDVPADRRLVVTTDTVIAGVHFRAADAPATIAAKALRVNLSDLAAMGAEPFAYTLSAAFPDDVDEDWIAAFAGALAEEQARFRVGLIGGDTVATPGPLSLCVTAFGTVPEGRLLRRSAAQSGDSIYVSGTVGDAALGLRVAGGELPDLAPDLAGALAERYLRPRPRVELGLGLRALAHAVIDVSDGLVADLAHVCRESGVDAVVEASRVPLSPAVRAAVAADATLMETVLTGGDDYELLFTAPATASAAVEDLSADLELPLTVIGRLEEGDGTVRVVAADGRTLRFRTGGYRHFQGVFSERR